MSYDLEPRESADGDTTERGEGVQYGAGVKAEPARKVKELKTVKNSPIMAHGHNLEGASAKID